MSMDAGTLVSEQEYLSTSYQPDCEFEDGVLIERNVGTRDHSKLQIALGAYFYRRRKLWNIHIYPEQRIRLRPGRYKLPDLCVIQGPEPDDQVLQSPPLLAIEILSPDDRPIRVNDTVIAWLESGVPYVWVIDPQTLESELHTTQGRQKIEDGVLRLPGAGIEVPLHLLDEE